MDFMLRHGYMVIFVAVSIEEIGLPIPSGPVLLTAGALAALASRQDAVRSDILRQPGDAAAGEHGQGKASGCVSIEDSAPAGAVRRQGRCGPYA